MAQTDFVNTLLSQYGEDALTNQFEVSFNPISIVGSSVSFKDPLAMRVLTCSIPPQTISTYEVVKRGRKFSRPSGVSEQAYEFSFTYRIDKDYGTYTLISNWMKAIQEPVTMGSSSSIVNLNAWRVPVTVKAIDSADRTKAQWTINGAFPVEQDAIEFDEESGDPLIISVTMHFLNIVYPTFAPVSGTIPNTTLSMGEAKA